MFNDCRFIIDINGQTRHPIAFSVDETKTISQRIAEIYSESNCFLPLHFTPLDERVLNVAGAKKMFIR